MRVRVPCPKPLAFMAAALVAAAACNEPQAPEMGREAPVRVIAAAVSCAADVPAGKFTCEPIDRSAGLLKPQFLILGGQGIYVQLASDNVDYDAGTKIFSADVTVQNLIGQALGTSDGSTTTGVKVFFHSGPNKTGGTGPGPITVANPDDYGDFTGTNQPYHEYMEILDTDETSALKNWQFNAELDVQFVFEVFVEGLVEFPDGWVDVSPSDPDVGVGQTVALSAVVRNELGQPTSDQTVTWSTSNPSIADVDPSTGEVTGVAEGTCTVCAASPGPEADGCVTVTVKPVVYVSTLAAPEDPSVGGTSGITLQLDVTQIPEPVISMVGDVTWDPTLLDYLDDASGDIWDLVVTNEDPLGTLKFSAISTDGITDNVFDALTFTVEGLAEDCTQLVPTLTELKAIDPGTYEAIDLLARAIIVTEPVTVCVQP